MSQQDNKTPTFFKFEDLRVYNKAVDFVVFLMKLFESDKDTYYNRLIENATLIAINIVDGSVKNKTQFVEKLQEAKGNIRKVVVYTTVGQRKGLISDEYYENIRFKLIELTKMTGALITSLQKHNDTYHVELQHDDGFDENLTW